MSAEASVASVAGGWATDVGGACVLAMAEGQAGAWFVSCSSSGDGGLDLGSQQTKAAAADRQRSRQRSTCCGLRGGVVVVVVCGVLNEGGDVSTEGVVGVLEKVLWGELDACLVDSEHAPELFLCELHQVVHSRFPGLVRHAVVAPNLEQVRF